MKNYQLIFFIKHKVQRSIVSFYLLQRSRFQLKTKDRQIREAQNVNMNYVFDEFIVWFVGVVANISNRLCQMVILRETPSINLNLNQLISRHLLRARNRFYLSSKNVQNKHC